MSGRTRVNIGGYTVDDDVTLSDDLFNTSMGATLVLLGELRTISSSPIQRLGNQDFVANNAGIGGSLVFTDGSAETAVSLSGVYDPSGFHAAVHAIKRPSPIPVDPLR